MFGVLADPVRRRLVELLAEGDRTAGELTATVIEEFGINQPAVSNQLRSLRDAGVVTDVREGRLRRYHLERKRLAEIDAWLKARHPFPAGALDALETEVARGKRDRRRRPAETPASARTGRERSA
jgi:DNA-binding transcriptional ArsR family regulator